MTMAHCPKCGAGGYYETTIDWGRVIGYWRFICGHRVQDVPESQAMNPEELRILPKRSVGRPKGLVDHRGRRKHV